MMKLTAVCCTFNRPEYLGEMIQCFLMQDYSKEHRKLLILDDAGQYENIEGDGWKIVSVNSRFASLGEKRNACAALVDPDTEGLLVADDDDIYYPWWFSAHAAALACGEWSCPTLVYCENGNLSVPKQTGGMFHGAHAFRRSTFRKLMGYKAMDSGEDADLFSRLHEAGSEKRDPCDGFPPYYLYRFRGDVRHISAMDHLDGYRLLGEQEKKDLSRFAVVWNDDYLAHVTTENVATNSRSDCLTIQVPMK